MNDLFRLYMLTGKNDSERDQLRERLLTDQGFSDELREQENDWIDAAAAGNLAPADRALLHSHLANTGQLHRLATAAALAKPKSAPQKSIYPYAFAIAALVLLCLAPFIATERGRRESTKTLAFTLTPGTLRDSSEVQSIRISKGNEVHLLYQDTAPAGGCIVIIRDAGGATVDDSESPCGMDFHAHTLRTALPPGRYTAELADAQRELIHAYLFDVTR